MADAQTPLLTDEAAPVGYVRTTDLPVATERGALVFRTPDADWSTPVYLGAPPAQPGEPVAWRSRHRSEIGMIGNYPWFFVERKPTSAMSGSFEVQPLYTHPAPSQPSPTMADALAAGDGTLHGAVDHWQEQALAGRAVMQQALNALQTLHSMQSEWHAAFPEHVGDKEAPAMQAALAAIAALSATMEKPNGK